MMTIDGEMYARKMLAEQYGYEDEDGKPNATDSEMSSVRMFNGNDLADAYNEAYNRAYEEGRKWMMSKIEEQDVLMRRRVD